MREPSAAPAHTPEPWRHLGWEAGDGVIRGPVQPGRSAGALVAVVGGDTGDPEHPSVENGDRIVACVNALKGVSDAAAVRALVAAAREACDALHLAYFEVLRSRGSASGDDEASDRAASEPAVVALSRALAAFPDGAK